MTVVEAIPGRALQEPACEGRVLADVEGSTGATAPGELSGSFQGPVQESRGSGWSSLGRRGYCAASACPPGFAPSPQAVGLGIRSDCSCPPASDFLTDHPLHASPSPQAATLTLPAQALHLPSCCPRPGCPSLCPHPLAHSLHTPLPVVTSPERTSLSAHVKYHDCPHPHHSPAPLFSPQNLCDPCIWVDLLSISYSTAYAP